MRKCDFPRREEETDYLIPFKCNYCGGYFCPNHRLPSTHSCPFIFVWKSKPPPIRATPAKRIRRHIARVSKSYKPLPQTNQKPTKHIKLPPKQYTTERTWPIKTIVIVFLLLLASATIYTHPEIISSLPNNVDEHITTLEEAWVEFITPPLAKPEEIQRVETLIVVSINELRSHELIWNEKLAQAARLHSKDMAERGYFDHNTPEGTDVVDRVFAQGYDYFFLGENIYMISGDSRITPEELATLCVEGWYDSYGHRQIMLSPDYQDIGVGVYLKGSDIYVTADFGTT